MSSPNPFTLSSRSLTPSVHSPSSPPSPLLPSLPSLPSSPSTPPSLSLSSICYRGKVQMVSMIFNGMYLSSHLALLLPPPTATPLIDKAIVVTPSSLVKVPVSMSTHPSLVCTMFHVCMCAARTGTRRLWSGWVGRWTLSPSTRDQKRRSISHSVSMCYSSREFLWFSTSISHRICGIVNNYLQ